MDDETFEAAYRAVYARARGAAHWQNQLSGGGFLPGVISALYGTAHAVGAEEVVLCEGEPWDRGLRLLVATPTRAIVTTLDADLDADPDASGSSRLPAVSVLTFSLERVADVTATIKADANAHSPEGMRVRALTVTSASGASFELHERPREADHLARRRLLELVRANLV